VLFLQHAFYVQLSQTIRLSATMARSENLPAETMGELDIPPDNAETNKKPKEASWRTTPEENKQETMEIPTWPLNQPFSSTLTDKPRSILRQGVLRVKREKRFLINNNNNKEQSQTQQMLLMMQQQIAEQRRIQSEEKVERLEQRRIQKVERLEQRRIQKVERLEQRSIQNKTSTRVGKMLLAFTLGDVKMLGKRSTDVLEELGIRQSRTS
jgi:hypothetical protein